MTPEERIDANIKLVLREVWTDFDMCGRLQQERLREAMRQIMSASYIAGSNDNHASATKAFQKDAERYHALRSCIGNKDLSLYAQSLFWNVSSKAKFDAAVDAMGGRK